MRILLAFISVIFSISVSQAVILLPGKIEEPARANKIMSERFKGKKAFLNQHRKRIKEKFASLKKIESTPISNSLLTPAPLRDESTLRSKGVATDGTLLPDPDGRQLQEVQ